MSNAADLITNARARVALPNADATGGGADDNAINYLITACSKQIAKYCQRTFALTAFDELYNGSGGRSLVLRNFPIVSVQSVRFRPAAVLKVRNTDAANVQKARVWVDAANLYCQDVQSAVSTTHTIAFASYPTLSAVAAQVAALSGAWQALITPGYEKWPAADLYPPIQGAQNAAGVYCDLRMHVDELTGFTIDAARGYLLRALVATDPDYLLPSDATWPSGQLNFRVQYTAGFATIPEDVQEACAQLVALYFKLDAREVANQPLPPSIQNLLKPWKQHTITSFGA